MYSLRGGLLIIHTGEADIADGLVFLAWCAVRELDAGARVRPGCIKTGYARKPGSVLYQVKRGDYCSCWPEDEAIVGRNHYDSM